MMPPTNFESGGTPSSANDTMAAAFTMSLCHILNDWLDYPLSLSLFTGFFRELQVFFLVL